MKLLEYAAHVAVNWCIAAVIVAGAWSFVATRHKARARRAAAEVSDLLADFPQPLNKWLTPELTDRMFDELIAMEGLS